jgi:sugar/nucleoside kinase (ribokinase family)
MTASDTLLFGALSRDVYLGRDLVLPGGGVLNMAWAWSRAGIPFTLLSRIGDDDPDLFRDFLVRHGITCLPGSLVGSGPSASIDIVIQADRQPHMDHFVGGVWDSLTLTGEEMTVIGAAQRLHVVLVEGAIETLERLGAGGHLGHLQVTADFLGFRHYTVERFARTLRRVDIGFVGWPGDPDDPTVHGIRDVAHADRKLVIVTLGERGVLVFDGRHGPRESFIPVEPVAVRGTTVGCGDAFIAACLASLWRDPDIAAAVEAGKAAGAEATAWRRPVPDAAYGPTSAEALRLADEEAQEHEHDPGDRDGAPDPRLPA